MTCAVIIRRHDGAQSYLVLDEQPRELLYHYGFQEQYSMRPWLGSVDSVDAMEEWCEMLAEDIMNYTISDEDNWEYCQDKHHWDACQKK